MGKSKAQVIRFERTNRGNISLKDRSNRTRTGQFKTGKVKAHPKKAR
jgi:hypothetical protein